MIERTRVRIGGQGTSERASDRKRRREKEKKKEDRVRVEAGRAIR